MKFLFLLLLSISASAYADVCICQYPKKDAKYGRGFKKEVFFYKMGCAAWLITEKECRKQKIIDINKPLSSYLDKVLKQDEKIRLGYVGHWKSSNALISFLKKEVEPLMGKYRSPILVDNTACLAMNDAEKVQRYLDSIPSTESLYMSVKGNQTTSIGMWDKLSVGYRKADLVAYADSRGTSFNYPACNVFLEKRCTAFQNKDVGYCTDEGGVTRELVCHNVIKEKRNDKLKRKKAKKWFLVEDIREKLKALSKQNRR